MEASIENGDLRHSAAKFFDQCDSFEFQAVVQGRKDGHLFDRRFDLARNHSGLVAVATSVHDAMAHDIDFRERRKHTSFSRGQFAEQLCGCGGAIAFLRTFF